MKIADVCRTTGVSKRNIHYYIQEKLITPAINPHNNYYDFSEEDCEKLRFIVNMRNANMPIQAIRSIIEYPVAAPYYLTECMQKMKREQRRLEQTLISLQYILDCLPIYPDFTTIGKLTDSAGIPEPAVSDFSSEFDRYSIILINRFLWGSFLPETKWSEYQEFLWAKANRIVLENPSDDYIRLAKTLYSIEQNRLNRLLALNSERYAAIAELDSETLPKCVADMIDKLSEISQNEKYVLLWKKMYKDFFVPSTNIQTSDLALLIIELSPFFKQYVANINQVCNTVYNYLCSSEGRNLYRILQENFETLLDLSCANHGQIEAIYSLPQLYSLLVE